MDNRQFIAALASALAWPAIIGYLLYLIRDELKGLAGRVEEVSGWGARATFRKELEAAQKADVPTPEGSPPLVVDATADRNKTLLQQEAPFASVLLGYAELEKVLVEIRTNLQLSPRTNLISIVRELATRGYIGDEVVQSFNALRLARNAAAHAQTTITPNDAANFNYTAERLLGVFEFVKASLK
jgi:hypothetical protein